MLDPSNDFNAPCYDDIFRRNFYFKEFNVLGEYFIELDYWIMREAWKSRLGRALDLNLRHYDDGKPGELIFRDVSSEELALLASRNYFLGDEVVEAGTSKYGDIYHVTEVYVYAPSGIFSSWTTEVINFPKLVNFDYNYSKEYSTPQISYLCGLDEVGFENADMTIGDEFYIERDEQRVYGVIYYACRTSTLTVSRREGSKIWAKASTFTNPYSGNTWTPREVLFSHREKDNLYVRVRMASKTFAARSLQVPVRREVTFHLSKPDVEEKFRPVDTNGLESEQVDSGTTPTFVQYQSMMASGSEIRSAPSNIVEAYKGLWRRENFFTAAR